MVFVIHWHESALDIHVFPILIPPSTSLSTQSLWVFPVHQVQTLVSCIKPGLVICFTLDNIHASMLFSWNVPPSPSPTESKSLFYTCVSFSVLHIGLFKHILTLLFLKVNFFKLETFILRTLESLKIANSSVIITKYSVFYNINQTLTMSIGLLRWFSGKESTCQCGRPWFDSWVGKIPYSRKRQPTPVFLLRKFHGQRILADYCLWSHKESDMTEHMYTMTIITLACVFEISLYVFCFLAFKIGRLINWVALWRMTCFYNYHMNYIPIYVDKYQKKQMNKQKALISSTSWLLWCSLPQCCISSYQSHIMMVERERNVKLVLSLSTLLDSFKKKHIIGSGSSSLFKC